MNKSEGSLHELQDTIKRNNLCIIGVPKGGEREKGENTYLKK